MKQEYDSQTDYSQTEIVQSTTLRTVRNLKKLQESSTNLLDDFHEKSNNQPTNTSFYDEGKKHIQKAYTTEMPNKSNLIPTRMSKLRQSMRNPEIIDKQASQNRYKLNEETEGQMEGGTSSTIATNGVFSRQQRIQSGRTPKMKLGSMSGTQEIVTQKSFRENVQVDINSALNLMLQRSKNVKDRIESLELNQNQVNKFLSSNKFYKLSLTSLIQKLIQNGKLTVALTNVTKPTLTILENHTFQQLSKCIRLEKINEQYTQCIKGIDKQFDRRLQEIQVDIPQL